MVLADDGFQHPIEGLRDSLIVGFCHGAMDAAEVFTPWPHALSESLTSADFSSGS
jgi:hypothetical protein